MAWSRDNIIAILGLFATCAPIAILVTTFLRRRRQRGGDTQGKDQFKVLESDRELRATVPADMERLAPLPYQQTEDWYQGYIRRQPTLTVMIQIQKNAVGGLFYIRFMD